MTHHPGYVPRVDVVVPCYNYARFLRACVRSLLSQEGVEVRVLIIDDASSDETPHVGAELSSADPRVEFRRHEVNAGHIATYNEGLLGWSDADYVVLISADDMLPPGALARATRIMEADRSIGLVYGRPFYFHDEVKLPATFGPERPHTTWRGSDWVAGRCRAGHNVIASPEVVVRGSVQRAVGGYRKELPHVADFEMWLRIAAVANIAYVRGVPQAYYRRHPTSMSTRQTQLVDLVERRMAFDFFFRDYGRKLLDAAAWHDMARRALAREALWAACRAYDRNEVEESLASELIVFARETYADAERLPEWAALRRRQRLGPVLCHHTQIFAAPAIARRVRKWFWWYRWAREGV